MYPRFKVNSNFSAHYLTSKYSQKGEFLMFKIAKQILKIAVAVTGAYLIMKIPAFIGFVGSEFLSDSRIGDIYTFAEDQAENLVPAPLKNLIGDICDRVDTVRNVVGQ